MVWVYGARGADGKVLALPLLGRAAKLCLGWDRLPAVGRSAGGKPFFPERPDIWFSLSHSGGLALCALSDRGPVGADIERVRPRRVGLGPYILSAGGAEEFDGSWEAFYRIWVLKESWCKREDIPLYPPRRLPETPPCPHQGYEGAGWRAAVCAWGSPPGEICWLDPAEF